MLYSLVSFPKISSDISAPSYKTFSNSPCFTQVSPNSLLIPVYQARYTLTSLPLFLPLPSFLWSLYPFPSVTATFPQTHRRPIASAKLDDLLSHEQAPLVPLLKGKQMVLPSISYCITLMVANFGSMHFSFPCVHFSGVLQLP